MTLPRRHAGSSHARHVAAMTLGCAALIALAGCNATPEPASARFDLETCLGPIDDAAPAGCRGRLAQQSGAAGCFVAVAGEVTDRRVVQWVDGRLEPDNSTPSDFDSGQRVTSALFLGVPCDQTPAPDDGCAATPGCQLKLGPVDQTIAVEGTTVIDFTIGGVCQVDQGILMMGESGEPCDGIDNDCDGAIDEDIMLPPNSPCEIGVGACRTTGDRRVCVGAERACGDAGGQVLPGAPAVGDATCDEIDDDCDGEPDEDGGCNACSAADPCTEPDRLQCVDGVCRGCDPETHVGCPTEQPLCDAETYTCRVCNGDGECDNGTVCTPFVGCTACDPARPATCADPLQPVCDPMTFTCRPCRGEGAGDCPTGFCSGGRCGGCDPNAPDGGGCANPSPICDIRDVACRGCTNDNECSESHPDEPICRNNNCQACEVGSNAGCFEIDKPVCALVEGTPTCVPCDAQRPCLVGTCTDGQCVGCDPETNAGCLLDSPRPYCDPGAGGGPENAFCRECRVDNECPGERICREEGRCVFCVNATGEGCDEQGAEPVCGNGACRVCRNDGECVARDGARDECVGGACALCDPVDNAGCDDPERPACRAGRCQACIDDGECLEALAGQCIASSGECAACDPLDDAGCGPASPICDEDDLTCRRCEEDVECGQGAICNGAGRCETCDPNARDDDDPLVARGCNEASPICTGAPGEFACGQCQRDDQCSGGQCLDDGRCKPCDPHDYAGCDDPDSPICDAATFICRGCTADGDCGRNGLAAVCDISQGQCVVCTERGDAYPGCDPDSDRPVCGRDRGQPTCLGCQNDDQCTIPGTGYCVGGGRCAECAPGTPGNLNRGCNPDSTEPVCDGGLFRCTGCEQNFECNAINPERPRCEDDDGRCVECTANIHCSGETPFCDDGTCVGCPSDEFCRDQSALRPQCLADGRCAECDPDSANYDGCGGVRPICNRNTLSCQACAAGDCLVGNCTPEGCELCNPNEPTDCVVDANDPDEPAPPVCQVGTFKCVACDGDNDCEDHPYGPHCVDGRCACNPRGERCDLNTRSPVCNPDTGQCIACTNDDECIGNPFGATCDLMGGAGDCE